MAEAAWRATAPYSCVREFPSDLIDAHPQWR